MRSETLYSDGTEVPRNVAVCPDHYLTAFIIKKMSTVAYKEVCERFEIISYKWGYLTIKSAEPLVNDAMSGILGCEIEAFDQQVIVEK